MQVLMDVEIMAPIFVMEQTKDIQTLFVIHF